MLGVRTKPATMRVPVQATGRAGDCPDPQGWEGGPSHHDEWLATVAHELRSPLATILTGVDVIAPACDPDPVARRALAVMGHQLRQATRLVDDLFDPADLACLQPDFDAVRVVWRFRQLVFHDAAGQPSRALVLLEDDVYGELYFGAKRLLPARPSTAKAS